MNRKIFPLSYLLIFLLSGCSAQYGISKSYAYTKKITAGNIPVDKDNKPLSTGVQKVNIIFLEVDENQTPVWDTAWIDGKAYGIQPVKISSNKVQLGKLKDSDTEVVIEPVAGKTVWQLMTRPLAFNAVDEVLVNKMKSNAIVLQGRLSNKKIFYTIKETAELATTFGE